MALSPPIDRNTKLSPLWARRSITDPARGSSGRGRPIKKPFDREHEKLKACREERGLLLDQVYNLDDRIQEADEHLRELRQEVRLGVKFLPDCLHAKEMMEQRLATLKEEKDDVYKLRCDLQERENFQKDTIAFLDAQIEFLEVDRENVSILLQKAEDEVNILDEENRYLQTKIEGYESRDSISTSAKEN